MLDELDYPDEKPVISQLLVDSEGNLWVEEFRSVYRSSGRPSVRPIYWSIFDRESRWLGRVQVPPGVLVQTVNGDRVMAFWEDEYDAKHIRIYELLRGE